VYRALTDPAALRTWLAEHAEVSLPEGRFAFWGRSTPKGQPGRQRLLAAEPERLLRLAWLLDGDETTTEIRLEPDGPDDTVLTLTQTGAPTFEELLAGTGRVPLHDFWRLSIANLANHVEGRDLAPKRDFSHAHRDEARVDLTIDAPASAGLRLPHRARAAQPLDRRQCCGRPARRRPHHLQPGRRPAQDPGAGARPDAGLQLARGATVRTRWCAGSWRAPPAGPT
jgi:uncharacterized protein YndB with AHSA1/START domain